MSKLRVANILVQLALVWDDGEELTPGPELQPISIPLSRLSELSMSIPEQLILLENHHQAQLEQSGSV